MELMDKADQGPDQKLGAARDEKPGPGS